MKHANTDEQNKLFDIIGKNTKFYRNLYSLKKKKMTQENLAEIINMSVSIIGNLEISKVKQGISLYTLWQISNALEVPIQNFFVENPEDVL